MPYNTTIYSGGMGRTPQGKFGAWHPCVAPADLRANEGQTNFSAEAGVANYTSETTIGAIVVGGRNFELAAEGSATGCGAQGSLNLDATTIGAEASVSIYTFTGSLNIKSSEGTIKLGVNIDLGALSVGVSAGSEKTALRVGIGVGSGFFTQFVPKPKEDP
jgi:hypothetical protein